MKLKGFAKLSLQIAALSVSMLLLSFITETQFWLDHFNYFVPAGYCSGAHTAGRDNLPDHYHWNYRGWVYALTGVVYFGVTVAKIAMSHKGKDFK